MKIYRIFCAGFLLLATLTAGLAQATNPTPAMEAANTLFQAQKWDEATAAYGKVTVAEPRNGMAWYRLGTANHNLKRYGQAAQAFQKSVEIGANPSAMYNLACALARLDKKDEAFRWLSEALTKGPFLARGLAADEDLQSLHNDTRWPALVTQAASIATPCLVGAEYKQFDFWVGEWDVFSTGGQQVGRSTIQKLTDGCIIMENWSDMAGGSGKSINYYDSANGQWHQHWMGSGGTALDLAGSFSEGALRYEGVTVQKDGSKLLGKMVFTPLAGGRVQQRWEQSTDGGKTWSVVFDGTYVKKKSS